MESQTNISEATYESLPDFLKDLTNLFTGAERDIILLSSLGVLSAALPKVIGTYDSNSYRPNLYVMIIAPAASGKSVMNKSKILIEEIHQQIMSTSLNDIEDCKSVKKTKKDLDSKCPELEVKIIPGNSSSSKIYKHLKNANDGILIFETEADTISAMIKQDWGNFSDVMRKAFHHETISISREADDKYIEVNRPELSMVISGTPEQVKPFIQSQENGLFSRFLFYSFDEVSRWKDVSPNATNNNFKLFFKNAGTTVLNLYTKLQNTNGNIEVTLKDSHWSVFNAQMAFLTDIYIHQNNLETISSIKRHGLMMFRIAMILTILRNKDNPTFNSTLECSDADFNSAFNIMKSGIDHSIKVSNILQNNKKTLPTLENIMMANLNQCFTRGEAVIQGESLKFPTRTVDAILVRWLKLNFVVKLFQGNYQKK